MLYMYLGKSLINIGSFDLFFLLHSTAMQMTTATTIINTMLPTIPKGIAITCCSACVGCAVGETGTVWKMKILHHLQQ